MKSCYVFLRFLCMLPSVLLLSLLLTPLPRHMHIYASLFAFCISQNTFIQSHFLYRSFFKQFTMGKIQILPIWSCSVSKSPYSSFFITLTDSLPFQLTFSPWVSISPHPCMNTVQEQKLWLQPVQSSLRFFLGSGFDISKFKMFVSFSI